ncbi:MAG: undecaprenyldiphospho-muramoylpentapeptide beta-N-acetylglucosaminyltransferase [Endozoicomonas sp. (ex Botrylloides leachii)]|nr:undecaprenyldiphospho-muramoylpentapeptide beta-N-acetylglucosaminyltransferase [Endozoicomonas sp. (ex Botrylloides leachii)]
MRQCKQSSTIVIMAGGTGGHIFPALATASELKSRGYNIHWLGTINSMESELVPQYGFDISFIPVTGLRGKKIGLLLQAPWRLIVSLLRAIKVLRQIRPICVLGMGGYVTGPGGIAARLLNIPLVIHEQNAITGLTNKLLSNIATRLLEAFPGTFLDQKARTTKKIFTTGNPVRESIAEYSAYDVGTPLKLLVLGGSRGAVAINDVVPKVIANCKGRVIIWHQTGKNNLARSQQSYRELFGERIDLYRVEPFINDMAKAYAWADVVLCRSGALTVSELAAAGRPAILVPFPYAVDDHQTVNGRYLVDQGAAWMIKQQHLDEDALTTLLLELSNDHTRLNAMAAAAKAAGQLKATKMVADHCLEVSHD